MNTMTDTQHAPRSVQLAMRVSPEQKERLETIARERGFLGGPGRAPGEPNISLAARWLMGESDREMRENDLVLEWDRNPG